VTPLLASVRGHAGVRVARSRSHEPEHLEVRTAEAERRAPGSRAQSLGAVDLGGGGRW
jgi:hypothetical protein